jgi:hypothetical protein
MADVAAMIQQQPDANQRVRAVLSPALLQLACAEPQVLAAANMDNTTAHMHAAMAGFRFAQQACIPSHS